MRLLELEEIALRWGELAPLINEALDHGVGESSSYDILVECLSANAQCWEHEDLIAITRFNHFSQYKQLQVVTTTGTGWMEHGPYCLEWLEDFARATGCRNVAIWGRPGWKKLLKDYHEPYTVLYKEVTNENND